MKTGSRRRSGFRFLITLTALFFMVFFFSTSVAAGDSFGWIGRALMGLFHDFLIFISDFLIKALAFFINIFERALQQNPQIYPLKDPTKSLIMTILNILVPFMVFAAVITGGYIVFLSASPRNVAHAKRLLKRIILAMVVVSSAPIIYQLLINISQAATGSVLIITKTKIAVGGGGLGDAMVASFSGMNDYQRMLFIFIFANLFTFTFIALGVAYLRWLMVWLYSIIFPVALFLYMIDQTRHIGREVLKSGVTWIFSSVLMAVWLAVAVAVMQGIKAGTNPLFGIMFIYVAMALVILSPLILTGFMATMGAFVSAASMFVPGTGGVLLAAAGGIMQGKGPEALISAGTKGGSAAKLFSKKGGVPGMGAAGGAAKGGARGARRGFSTGSKVGGALGGALGFIAGPVGARIGQAVGKVAGAVVGAGIGLGIGAVVGGAKGAIKDLKKGIKDAFTKGKVGKGKKLPGKRWRDLSGKEKFGRAMKVAGKVAKVGLLCAFVPGYAPIAAVAGLGKGIGKLAKWTGAATIGKWAGSSLKPLQEAAAKMKRAGAALGRAWGTVRGVGSAGAYLGKRALGASLRAGLFMGKWMFNPVGASLEAGAWAGRGIGRGIGKIGKGVGWLRDKFRARGMDVGSLGWERSDGSKKTIRPEIAAALKAKGLDVADIARMDPKDLAAIEFQVKGKDGKMHTQKIGDKNAAKIQGSAKAKLAEASMFRRAMGRVVGGMSRAFREGKGQSIGQSWDKLKANVAGAVAAAPAWLKPLVAVGASLKEAARFVGHRAGRLHAQAGMALKWIHDKGTGLGKSIGDRFPALKGRVGKVAAAAVGISLLAAMSPGAALLMAGAMGAAYAGRKFAGSSIGKRISQKLGGLNFGRGLGWGTAAVAGLSLGALAMVAGPGWALGIIGAAGAYTGAVALKSYGKSLKGTVAKALGTPLGRKIYGASLIALAMTGPIGLLAVAALKRKDIARVLNRGRQLPTQPVSKARRIGRAIGIGALVLAGPLGWAALGAIKYGSLLKRGGAMPVVTGAQRTAVATQASTLSSRADTVAANPAGNMREAGNLYAQSATAYERIGDFERATEMREKAGDSYSQAGGRVVSRGRVDRDRVQANSMAGQQYQMAAENRERMAGQSSLAGNDTESKTHLDRAGELREKAGDAYARNISDRGPNEAPYVDRNSYNRMNQNYGKARANYAEAGSEKSADAVGKKHVGAVKKALHKDARTPEQKREDSENQMREFQLKQELAFGPGRRRGEDFLMDTEKSMHDEE